MPESEVPSLESVLSEFPPAVGYRVRYLYQGLGWYDDPLVFSDRETAESVAEVEQILVGAGKEGSTGEYFLIVSFEIVEVNRVAVQ